MHEIVICLGWEGEAKYDKCHRQPTNTKTVSCCHVLVSLLRQGVWPRRSWPRTAMGFEHLGEDCLGVIEKRGAAPMPGAAPLVSICEIPHSCAGSLSVAKMPKD